MIIPLSALDTSEHVTVVTYLRDLERHRLGKRQLPRALPSGPIRRVYNLNAPNCLLCLEAGKVTAVHRIAELFKERVKPARVTGVSPMRANEKFLTITIHRVMCPVSGFDLQVVILDRDCAFFSLN